MKLKDYNVKDSKIKYKRIPIETVYPNGSKGSLAIETPFLFSFGLNEKKDQNTNKLVGYSLPVCLWEKDGRPNLAEEIFYTFLCKLTEICKKHLEEEYGSDLASSLSEPLYYKQVEFTDKKGKKKTKQTPQLHQFFMRNLFTLIKQKRFFHFFEQRVSKK